MTLKKKLRFWVSTSAPKTEVLSTVKKRIWKHLLEKEKKKTILFLMPQRISCFIVCTLLPVLFWSSQKYGCVSSLLNLIQVASLHINFQAKWRCMPKSQRRVWFVPRYQFIIYLFVCLFSCESDCLFVCVVKNNWDDPKSNTSLWILAISLFCFNKNTFFSF